tara:strand:+ start:3790 stop:3990 length:201 start_codon:yes stop_codon:yes gene_type:complete
MRVTILGVKEEKRYAPPVHELFQKAHLKKGALGTQIPSLHRISDTCFKHFLHAGPRQISVWHIKSV